MTLNDLQQRRDEILVELNAICERGAKSRRQLIRRRDVWRWDRLMAEVDQIDIAMREQG